jgi:hypothetical protein
LAAPLRSLPASARSAMDLRYSDLDPDLFLDFSSTGFLRCEINVLNLQERKSLGFLKLSEMF